MIKHAFLNIIAAAFLTIMSACASHAPNNALAPALITPQDGQFLSSQQKSELTHAIITLGAPKDLEMSYLAIGNKAFTLTDRLTLGPKLPEGTVTEHLKTVVLLKTDGTDCFLVNPKNNQTVTLKMSRCMAIKK